MSVRVGGKGAIQGFMYQSAVVGVQEGKGDDAPVALVRALVVDLLYQPG